eukprot:8069341-Karenia_brevis.AAC.1
MEKERVEVTNDVRENVKDRFRYVNNAVNIPIHAKLKQLWDWHVRRFLGRRRWFMDRANQRVDRLVAEEIERMHQRQAAEERER